MFSSNSITNSSLFNKISNFKDRTFMAKSKEENDNLLSPLIINNDPIFYDPYLTSTEDEKQNKYRPKFTLITKQNSWFRNEKSLWNHFLILSDIQFGGRNRKPSEIKQDNKTRKSFKPILMDIKNSKKAMVLREKFKFGDLKIGNDGKLYKRKQTICVGIKKLANRFSGIRLPARERT